MPRFRVIKVEINDFVTDKNKSVTESVKWEGNSLTELSEKYPPSRIFGADELGHHEIEDGWIRWDHRFEVMQDGVWVECEKDPRRPLGYLTEREQEIDAENRRLYPGDFLTEDYENCDNVDRDDWPEIDVDPCSCDKTSSSADSDCPIHGSAQYEDGACGFTQTELDEMDKTYIGFQLSFITQWEKYTAIRWRSLTVKERQRIEEAEKFFGGRKNLLERRTQLTAEKKA